MLETANSVFMVDAQGAVLPLYGGEPPEGVIALLPALRQERPAAQKAAGGLVVSLPILGGHWCIWCLSEVPPLNGLGPLLTRLQGVTGGLLSAGAGLAPKPEPSLQLQPFAEALKAPLRKPAALVQFLGERLIEGGEASGLAVFQLSGGKIKGFWASDQKISRYRDLLRNLLNLVQHTEGLADPCRFDRDDDQTASPYPEAALILEKLGAQSLSLRLPAGGQGYGVLIFDAPEPMPQKLAQLPALLQLMRPLAAPQTASALRRWLRPISWVAGGAIAVFLLWPVPAKITLTGSAEPARASVAALSSDALLDAMLVRVGDQVEEGQIVARFHSLALTEQAAQERQTIAMEELNAQGALAKGDYGAVRLHESRARLAQLRLDETEARLARLEVRAPASGRVVSALPPHVTGASFTLGREVLRVQSGQDFLMVLTPSHVDARRIEVGMKGHAMFRGLTDRDYKIDVVSPPALVRDPQSGRDHMELLARIEGGDARLLAGLSGYARLEGEISPRLLGLSHYLIEYARTRLWTYLGLHL